MSQELHILQAAQIYLSIQISSLFSMRTSWINSINLLLFSPFFRKSLKLLRLNVPHFYLSRFFNDCSRYVSVTMSILSYPLGIMLNSLNDKLSYVSQTPDNVLTRATKSTKYAANLSFGTWKLLGSAGSSQ